MSFLEILALLIPSALIFATPLIFTGIGGVFSERSGVVNIGLEGIMVMGAFVAIYVNLTYFDEFGKGVIWLSLLAALVVGAVFSILLAVAAVTFRADQTVTGVAINMLGVAVGVFLTKMIYEGKGQTDNISAKIQSFRIDGLADIPVIGDIFFEKVYWVTIIAFAVTVLAWYIIYKTPFGLRLRAVGEHPMAADTMGINVARTRYVAVIISGALGGIGGAVVAMTFAMNFSSATIAGQGFMAIAAMIFGKWNPFGTLGAALFFGLAQTLAQVGKSIPVISEVPQVFLQILPYVLTILALAGFIGKAVAPKASGQPYIKGKR
jgi:general nucleoside transport system permease protein